MARGMCSCRIGGGGAIPASLVVVTSDLAAEGSGGGPRRVAWWGPSRQPNLGISPVSRFGSLPECQLAPERTSELGDTSNLLISCPFEPEVRKPVCRTIHADFGFETPA